MSAIIDFLQSGDTYVYPITLVEAIYDLDGNRLVNIHTTMNNNIAQNAKDHIYEIDRPTTIEVGGIPLGSHLKGKKLKTIIDELVRPWTPPGITIKTDPEPGTYAVTNPHKVTVSDNNAETIDQIYNYLGLETFTIHRIDVSVTPTCLNIDNLKIHLQNDRGTVLLKNYDYTRTTPEENLIPVSETIEYDGTFFGTTNCENVSFIKIIAVATDTDGRTHEESIEYNLVQPIIFLNDNVLIKEVPLTDQEIIVYNLSTLNLVINGTFSEPLTRWTTSYNGIVVGDAEQVIDEAGPVKTYAKITNRKYHYGSIGQYISEGCRVYGTYRMSAKVKLDIDGTGIPDNRAMAIRPTLKIQYQNNDFILTPIYVFDDYIITNDCEWHDISVRCKIDEEALNGIDLNDQDTTVFLFIETRGVDETTGDIRTVADTNWETFNLYDFCITNIEIAKVPFRSVTTVEYTPSKCITVSAGSDHADTILNLYNQSITMYIPNYLGDPIKIIDKNNMDILPIFCKTELEDDNPLVNDYTCWSTIYKHGDHRDWKGYLTMSDYDISIYFREGV